MIFTMPRPSTGINFVMTWITSNQRDFPEITDRAGTICYVKGDSPLLFTYGCVHATINKTHTYMHTSHSHISATRFSYSLTLNMH